VYRVHYEQTVCTPPPPSPRLSRPASPKPQSLFRRRARSSKPSCVAGRTIFGTSTFYGRGTPRDDTEHGNGW
jgi:hypothetical protein